MQLNNGVKGTLANDEVTAAQASNVPQFSFADGRALRRLAEILTF